MSNRTNVRIVSILGLGKPVPPHYDECIYTWGNDSWASQPTTLVQRALVELFQPAQRVWLMGTSKVEERWLQPRERGGTPLLDATIPPQRRHFLRVPEGSSHAELQTLFETMLDGLSADPIPELGEQVPPAEIVVDVTHGFRVQPMMGLAAIGFQLSRWRRERRTDAPAIRVVYGAWEHRTVGDPASGRADRAPIWDITPFVTVAHWNDAITSLLRFGSADDLKALTDELAQAERNVLEDTRDRVAQQNIGWLNRLGSKAEALATDMRLARTPQLILTSSQNMLQTLDDPIRNDWIARYPLLREPVESLTRTTAGLHATSLTSADGLRAIAHLAERLVEHHREAGALQLVSEASDLLWGLLTCPAGTSDLDVLLKTGAGGVNKLIRRKATDRDTDRDTARDTAQDATTGAPDAAQDDSDFAATFATLAGELRGLRNDVAHGGLRDSSAKATKLAETIPRLVSTFSQLVERMPAPGSRAEVTPSTAANAVNLTATPADRWTDAERDVVRATAGATLDDLPGWDTRLRAGMGTGEIVSIAMRTEVEVRRTGATAAIIECAPDLASALVARLQGDGSNDRPAIACWLPVRDGAGAIATLREYPTLHRCIG